jgi:hypothetical protein
MDFLERMVRRVLKGLEVVPDSPAWDLQDLRVPAVCEVRKVQLPDHLEAQVQLELRDMLLEHLYLEP